MISVHRLEVGHVLSQTMDEWRNNALAGIAIIGVLVGGNLIIDAYAGEAASIIPSSFASLGAQYAITAVALKSASLGHARTNSRFLSLWGMSILTGLGILLGVIALIVPGLYLAARWFVAAPAILAEDISAGDGMSRSWDLTAPTVWSIFGLLLIFYIPVLIIVIVFAVIVPDAGLTTTNAVTYAALYGAQVTTWLAAVSVYRLLVDPVDELAEVFA